MPQLLQLTGERTAPGHPREQYWFTRHEVAYAWITERFRAGRLGAGRLGAGLAGAVTVEAGSGEGYGSDILRRAGARVVALEYDASAIEHSSSAYPAVGHVRSNLAAIPLKPGSADIVVCMQVIEHLWDLTGFLTDCMRLLRPGGLMIASTPNRPMFSPGLQRGEKPTNPFHVEEFDDEQCRAMLNVAGFVDVEGWGVHHGTRLASWRDRAGRGVVSAHVAAALAEAAAGTPWPQELEALIATLSASDFEIRQTLDSEGRPCARPDAEDLIVLGRKP